jgi:hypothetical protein
MILVISLFFLALLGLLSLGLAATVPQELFSAGKSATDAQAHYAALAGVEHATAWLTYVTTVGANPTIDAPNANNPIYNLDNLGESTSWGNTNDNIPSDPFGCPTTNMEFKQVTLSAVSSVPTSTFGVYLSGSAALGPQGLNVPTANASASACLQGANITIGDWTISTYIVPDSVTPGGYMNWSSPGPPLNNGDIGGSNGQRCYQIISIASRYGVAKLRARSTILEQSFTKWGLFSNINPTTGPDGSPAAMTINPNEVMTQGPMHTNGFFQFYISNPSIWSQTFQAIQGANGQPAQLSYSGVMPTSSNYLLPASIDPDGVGWVGGNYGVGAANQAQCPFNITNGANMAATAGSLVTDRYSTLMTGGRAAIQPTSNIPLPSNSGQIASMAFGANPDPNSLPNGTTMSQFGTAVVLTSTQYTGVNTQGAFIATQGGVATGGVYINGNVSNMFLETVDPHGLPMTTLSAVEGVSGTVTDSRALNSFPSLRLEMSYMVTATAVGPSMTTSQYTSATAFSQTYGGGGAVSASLYQSLASYKYTTNSATTWSSNASHVSQYASYDNSYTGPASNLASYYLTASYVGGGDSGDPVYTSFYGATESYYSASYGTATGTYTSMKTVSYGTPTTSVTSVTSGLSSYRVLTGSAFESYKAVSTGTYTYGEKVTASGTIASATALTPFHPIDRVIQTVNGALTLTASYNWGNVPNWNAPVGANTAASPLMDPMTVTALSFNGVAYTGSSTLTLPSNTVVLMRQERGNPSVVDISTAAAPAGTTQASGAYLNGAVFVEGNVGNLDGYNRYKQTIQTDLAQSQTIGIGDSIWQFGTTPGNQPLNALNGLGLVAYSFDLSAVPNGFSSASTPTGLAAGGTASTTPNSIYIYCALLANAGGLSYNNEFELGQPAFTQISPAYNTEFNGYTNTPNVEFFGSLIEGTRQIRSENSGGQITGWNDQMHFDQQLGISPPPGFPNSGGFAQLNYSEERM